MLTDAGCGDRSLHPTNPGHKSGTDLFSQIQSAELGYRPKNPVTLGEAERAEVEAFLEAIDADDDVQHVFAGLAD